jgi:hypothetical protein
VGNFCTPALEHRARDRRDSGKDEYVIEPKPGRIADRVVDQHRAGGDARHFKTRFVQIRAAAAQPFDGLGVELQWHAERACDGLGGDVVVRRADAAGRKNIAVFRAALVQLRDDRRLIVTNDTGLDELDAEFRKLEAEELQVRILRLSGQDLVADNHHAGRRRHEADRHDDSRASLTSIG